MPYLSNACISTITAPDFSSGAFYIAAAPQPTLHFLLTWDPNGLCAHTGSVDYPAAVTLSNSIDYPDVTCDSISYDQIKDPSGRLIVNCPLTYPLTAGDVETLTLKITGNYAGRQHNAYSAVVTVEDPATACTQSMTVTAPDDNLYYSTTDDSYLFFDFAFRPADCSATASGLVDVTIIDPSAERHVLSFISPTTSVYTPTTPAPNVLYANYFGLPTNGELQDGEYAILVSSRDSPDVIGAGATFIVGHQLMPTGGLGRRRGIESRWKDYVRDGGVLDSSFLYKGRRDACPFPSVHCPVPGQVGVFECVDTLNDIDSCGGCPGSGLGQACSEIQGAVDLACVAGKCVVSACEDGLTLSANRSACFFG